MSAVLEQRAARRAPIPGRPPAEESGDRPILRVVDRSLRTPAARRSRARIMGVLVLTVVAAALFGLVASHVALAQGQFRLDRLRQNAQAQQDRYERLRLQVAELESPGRIVAAAQERLGMVPPPSVTYLSPVGPATGSGSGVDAESTATEDWSTVKRQLASRP